jgi:hypothetical protein
MSQLYEVAFTAHFPRSIDVGKVLVSAPNQEMAIDTAALALGLPRSSTQCVVNRVRPAFYIIERREIEKTPGQTRQHRPLPAVALQKFIIMIEAAFSGRSEEHALRKLVEALNLKLAGRKRDAPANIKIDIVPLSQHARQEHALERIETYQQRSQT